MADITHEQAGTTKANSKASEDLLQYLIGNNVLTTNRQISFAYWLIYKMSDDNMVCMTYKQMKEQRGMTQYQVQNTMFILISCGFVIKHSHGVYEIAKDMSQLKFASNGTDRHCLVNHIDMLARKNERLKEENSSLSAENKALKEELENTRHKIKAHIEILQKYFGIE